MSGTNALIYHDVRRVHHSSKFFFSFFFFSESLSFAMIIINAIDFCIVGFYFSEATKGADTKYCQLTF